MEQATRLVRGVEDLGLAMILAQTKMVLGVGTVLQGEMARGVRMIEDAAVEAEKSGQTGMRAFGDLFLGETYLQIATSEEKPPLAVMLRNLPFLLRTLPFAKQKARRFLARALGDFRRLQTPSQIARCLFLLGQLDQAGKRAGAARTKFEEARTTASSVEATNLVADIDAALAELPVA